MVQIGSTSFHPYYGEPDHTQSSYRETPFFLVYGVKACLPSENIMGSPRV
jgi:hypothetical protein